MTDHSLTVLTRTIAATCNPKTMTLKDIDRLYNAVEQVITDRPTYADLLALDRLANKLDEHREKRRLAKPATSQDNSTSTETN